MTGALVLAAGSSRRFGDDKRRAKLPNGRLVLQQTLINILAAFEDVLVVLRHDDDTLQQQLANLFPDTPLNTYLAPDSASGMGHSLAGGIGEVSDWQGAFICLGDMPHIQPDTYRLLSREMAAHEKPIIIPYYEAQRGHPVGFHQQYFQEISQVTGDQGAVSVLQRHPDAIIRVAVTDPGVISDIDTPGDLGAS